MVPHLTLFRHPSQLPWLRHLQALLAFLPPEQHQLLLCRPKPALAPLHLLMQAAGLRLQVLPAALQHLVLGKAECGGAAGC